MAAVEVTSPASAATPLLTVLSPVSNLTWAGEEEPSGAPKKTGTIFSSAMNLAACALGASMLSLPYTMQVSGPIVALEFLLFFAIMAFFSAQAVVNAGLHCKKSSYAAIVTHYFGSAWGTVAEVLLSVALLVAAISYIVGLSDLLPVMLPFTAHLDLVSRLVVTLTCLYPVTLISSLAAFGPASAIAAGGCYLQALALVGQLFSTGETTTAWEVPPLPVWTAVDMGGLLYSLPMICFVYAYHYVLTDTLCELENPTRMRMALVNLTSIGIMIGCYVPVSVAGYLAYSGKGITSNVLTGLPPGSVTVLVATWSIGGLLLLTYSLFIIPLRRRLETKMLGELTTDMWDVRRMVIAAALNGAVLVAALALPDLGLANALAGGCIALIMFYFPGRLMVRYQADMPFELRDPLRIGIGAIFTFMGVLICISGLFGNLIFDY